MVDTILKQIEGLGYGVRMQRSSRGLRIVAVDPRAGVTFTARSEVGDRYVAALLLAQLLGLQNDKH